MNPLDTLQYINNIFPGLAQHVLIELLKSPFGTDEFDATSPVRAAYAAARAQIPSDELVSDTATSIDEALIELADPSGNFDEVVVQMVRDPSMGLRCAQIAKVLEAGELRMELIDLGIDGYDALTLDEIQKLLTDEVHPRYFEAVVLADLELIAPGRVRHFLEVGEDELNVLVSRANDILVRWDHKDRLWTHPKSGASLPRLWAMLQMTYERTGALTHEIDKADYQSLIGPHLAALVGGKMGLDLGTGNRDLLGEMQECMRMVAALHNALDTVAARNWSDGNNMRRVLEMAADKAASALEPSDEKITQVRVGAATLRPDGTLDFDEDVPEHVRAVVREAIKRR